ncbi:phage tail assembly chaperone [Novosphingobium sp. KACC 22771]|uniref:phage tail assembly chaperone n=1 Tax=Novosphingobium sp. KACC 22771 TaxID=3025670 RepID=UPI0023666BC2|nr:phage tail assembly chaperone [Novosphingobium sp. KACC 22771]WDF72397.1 phage tail assembly chaperone [Novosphingobium sp. KACC 22771]
MEHSASFGPAARRLAGLAARLLGWRPHEFWGATPAELAAILAPDAAPGAAPGAAPLSREEMNRLMERDHG